MPVPALLPTTWLPNWQDARPPLPLVTELRPATLDYGERLYTLENAALGGPAASPVFGPTVAQADVYWRFYAATGRGTWLPGDAATLWRDTAVAGSLLALNRLVDETVDRAPQIAAMRTAADLLVNPNLELHAPAGQRPRLGHQTGGANQRKLADQELLQGLPPDHRPDPKIGVGVDWSTRSSDAPVEAPLIEYGAWFAMSNIGVTNLRADLDLLRGAWAVTAREKLLPGFFLTTSARSADRSLTPGVWSVGCTVNFTKLPGWTWRFDRRQSLDGAQGQAGIEAPVTWTLSLRAERKTATPRGNLY